MISSRDMQAPQRQIHRTVHNTARMVVINHPNSFDALCFRKIYTTASGQNEVGGFVVLGNEDSAGFDFRQLGYAKILFVEPYQPSKLIVGDIQGNDARVKVAALIECDVEGEFESDKGDLLYLIFNQDIGLCYEIVGIELPIGLPTAMHAKRYQLNKRDDLDWIAALPHEEE